MQAESKASVQVFWDASMRADIEVIEEASLPYGGVHRGADGFMALIKRVFSTLWDTQVSSQSVDAEVDQVVMLATMTGRDRATVTDFTMPIVEVWTLPDGLILCVTPHYLDTQLLCDIAAGRA